MGLKEKSGLVQGTKTLGIAYDKEPSVKLGLADGVRLGTTDGIK